MAKVLRVSEKAHEYFTEQAQANNETVMACVDRFMADILMAKETQTKKEKPDHAMAKGEREKVQLVNLF